MKNKSIKTILLSLIVMALCGKIFSLSVTNDTFTVTCDGITYSAAVGETVTLK